MNGETQQAGIYEGTAGYTVNRVNNNALIIKNVLMQVFSYFESNSKFLQTFWMTNNASLLCCTFIV